MTLSTQTASASLVPVVGMDATLADWTDRYPYRVCYVSPSGKTLRVKELRAIRTDKNGMSECQEYRYEEQESTEATFRLTKKGWKSTTASGTLHLGHARRYHDFSF